ncbi:MAG: hypothetical protein AB1716_26025 [Planctomycetota bacterium]
MSRPDPRNEALLGLAAGDLDGLTPDQIARLEGVLNRHPPAAARFAELTPAPGPALRAALNEWENSAQPSAAAWDAMWGRIVTATQPRAVGQATWLTPRVLRIWRPLIAAAACLLMAVLWLAGTPQLGSASEMPIRLASHVVVDQIEAGEGLTPVLVSTNPDTGIDLIWLVAEES